MTTGVTTGCKQCTTIFAVQIASNGGDISLVNFKVLRVYLSNCMVKIPLESPLGSDAICGKVGADRFTSSLSKKCGCHRLCHNNTPIQSALVVRTALPPMTVQNGRNRSIVIGGIIEIYRDFAPPKVVKGGLLLCSLFLVLVISREDTSGIAARIR